MNSYPTFRSIIDALGGSTHFGAVIGKSVGTASAMKTRDVIPPAHWDAVVRGARDLGLMGISHESLSRLYAARATRAAPPDGKGAAAA